MQLQNKSEQTALRHAWIELTQQCDLECIHCYNDSGPHNIADHPLSRNEYEELLVKLKELGCRSVQFIGGEPTIHPNLRDFIVAASALGFERIEVFSNLTHLSPQLISTMKECSVRVACSFYSDDPTIHETITKKKGSHRRTIDNMSKLIAAGVPLRAGLIVLPGINDQRIDETKGFLNSMGVLDVGLDRVRAVGRAQSECADQEGVISQLCGRCADGSVCIDPNGNVSPCIMSRIWKLGSVRESSISTMMSSRSWREFARLLDEARQQGYHKGHAVGAPCSPEDQCSPGACHPQIGGPPDCMPQNSCTPEVIPDR